MSRNSNRPGTTGQKVLSLLSVVCLLAFAALAVLQYQARNEQFFEDKDRIAKLAEAKFDVVKKSASSDWPQWRGPNRDGVAGPMNLQLDWPEKGPKILWEAPTGPGYSGIAVADGRTFTIFQKGDQETVACWNAEDGKPLWQFPYPARYRNDFGDGPRSTPTIDGPLVFTVGGTGVLHCLKSDSGEMVWRKDLLEEFNAPNLKWGVSFSPLVVGDLLLVTPGGPGGHSVVALDKATGAVRWKALDDLAGYGSPVMTTIAGQPQAVFFLETGLASLVPETGRLLWRFPWQTSYGANIATPIAFDDFIYISTGYHRGCALVKIERSGDDWKAVKIFENKKMCNHFSTSVRVGEHVYGFNDTLLTCMDLRTGKVAWTERGYDKGNAIAAEGMLIVVGENGQLGAVEANPAEYQEKSRAQLWRKKTWSAPALANGRLYVRNEEKIVCLDMK